MPRVYLDNAATSWPKPESVYQAVDHYQREIGVAAGRGAYELAVQTGQHLHQARHLLARLIGAESDDRIVFTYSGTDSLTLAIRGLLQRGDHVVTTVAEHNSVLRPLRFLEDAGEISVSRVGLNAQGHLDLDQLRDELCDQTRLVAVIHASNVTGQLFPIRAVADILAERPNTFLLVDAAQTVGHLVLDVRALGCDLLAAPAHKGLLGPLGTGLLYIKPGIERWLQPIRLGGTGSQSESDRQPETLPDRYESGNLNVPGLLGLKAGLEYLQERGIARVAAHVAAATKQLLLGLSSIDRVKLVGNAADGSLQTGVLSFQLDGFDPHEAAALLDHLAGVQARAGFHCAPLMHRALETVSSGGCIRLSVGPFTRDAEIETAVDAVRKLTT